MNHASANPTMMEGRDQSPFTVVVIGGGFSGLLVAANLLRNAGAPPLRVVLVERGPEAGVGVAYSTRILSHLLNVRAKNMSAFPEHPDDFVRWARTHDPNITGEEYLPRAWYGDYLRSVLDETRAARAGFAFEVCSEEAVDVDFDCDGGAVVRLSGGTTLPADCVVLAVGNFSPAVPTSVESGIGTSGRFVRSPWDFDRLAEFDRDDPLMLLGSGLTAADVVLALRDRGHRGRIHAVSRRGLLPIAHHAHANAHAFPIDESDAGSVRRLLKRIRAEAAAVERAGDDWRAVFDGLRPVTQELWRDLHVDEQRRFLRHARRYWDIHRHRVAPDVAETLHELVRTGMLTARAGRVLRCLDRGDWIEVTLRERASGAETTLEVSGVVNCTGPESDFRRLDDPLIAALRARGEIEPHVLGLGVRVTARGRLIDSDGDSARPFYALGGLRTGELWESIAVPELRDQAALVAEDIAKLAAAD